MEQGNRTVVLFFIIKGISGVPDTEALIFLLVLLIYVITLGGNLTILLLVCLDPQLHTPMYFFLGNLALLDMLSTTVTLHKVIISFITKDNTISYTACLIQIYIYLSLLSSELFLLMAMSYDRYVAICNPLRYRLIMNSKVCGLLTTVCWVCGFIQTLTYPLCLLDISCYKSNIINHFYCDILPLKELSCSDLYVLEMYTLFEGGVSGLTTFLLTLISYIFIIISIMKIQSNSGKSKAFHTCSSHLTVVILFYSTLFSLYLGPTSTNNLELKKLLTLVNTIMVPMLNPIIYSLKNESLTAALKRRLQKVSNWTLIVKNKSSILQHS